MFYAQILVHIEPRIRILIKKRQAWVTLAVVVERMGLFFLDG